MVVIQYITKGANLAVGYFKVTVCPVTEGTGEYLGKYQSQECHTYKIQKRYLPNTS
jgi:hypothetical protein